MYSKGAHGIIFSWMGSPLLLGLWRGGGGDAIVCKSLSLPLNSTSSSLKCTDVYLKLMVIYPPWQAAINTYNITITRIPSITCLGNDMTDEGDAGNNSITKPSLKGAESLPTRLPKGFLF